MAHGLKQHSHEERRRVIDALVPLIQRHVGANLVALAATGSFARGTDGAYSDIELFGFVKRRPDRDRAYIRFIHDGMLIDLWFLTRSEFIDTYKCNSRHRHYRGLLALSPLLDGPYVRALADVSSGITIDGHLKKLVEFWPEVQEATGKLLTAVARNDTDPLLFLYWQMVEKMCLALSLLNARAYTTVAAIFSEVRTFPCLPASLDMLFFPPDHPLMPSDLGERGLAVFEEMERLLCGRGLKLYEERLDHFVAVQSTGERLRRRLAIDRIARKTAKLANAIKVKLTPRNDGVLTGDTPKRTAQSQERQVSA